MPRRQRSAVAGGCRRVPPLLLLLNAMGVRVDARQCPAAEAACTSVVLSSCDFSQCTNLTAINLDGHALTGSIPSSMAALPTGLTSVTLANNHLTGTIPASLLQSNLRTLALFDTGLTGSIPVALGELSQLTYLNLMSTGIAGHLSEPMCNVLEGLDYCFLDGMYFSCDAGCASDTVQGCGAWCAGRWQVLDTVAACVAAGVVVVCVASALAVAGRSGRLCKKKNQQSEKARYGAVHTEATGYFSTTEAAATAILTAGQFTPTHGPIGPAVYFSRCVEEALRDVVHRDLQFKTCDAGRIVTLAATLKVGRVMHVEGALPSVLLPDHLADAGFDSVHLAAPRAPGPVPSYDQIVVLDPAQISDIRQLTQVSERQQFGTVQTTRVGYHAATKDAAQQIIQSGRLQAVAGGPCGSGTYLATSKEDARRKAAHGATALLRVVAKVGKVKHVSHHGDPAITVAQLEAEGFDSVLFHRYRTAGMRQDGGEEIVLYRPEQTAHVQWVE